MMVIQDLKQGLQDKWAQLNGQVAALSDKVQQTTVNAVAEARKTAQGELNNISEQMGRRVADGRSQVSSDLLKARMTVTAKAHEVKHAIGTAVSEGQQAGEKARAKLEMEAASDYAADSLDYALWAAAEAKVAYLEALEKQLAYEEKYGKDAQ